MAQIIKSIHQIAIKSDDELINSTNFQWKSLQIQQEINLYNNYNDVEWFNFIKQYILLLQSEIRRKHILLSIFPFYIIHIISQFSSPLFYPLFIIPNDNYWYTISIQNQKKKLILNHIIYKFEFFICNNYCDIKHKVSYYPHNGLFCCYNNFKDNKHASIIKHKTIPFINTTQIYVSLEIQYKFKEIIIIIKLNNEKNDNNNNNRVFCYKIGNKFLFETCGILLYNCHNFIKIDTEKYGTCSYSFIKKREKKEQKVI